MASVMSSPAENKVRISATRLLINNQWFPSASGKTFATVNPSTGEEICQIAEAGAADVELAVCRPRGISSTAAWKERCPLRIAAAC